MLSFITGWRAAVYNPALLYTPGVMLFREGKYVITGGGILRHLWYMGW